MQNRRVSISINKNQMINYLQDKINTEVFDPIKQALNDAEKNITGTKIDLQDINNTKENQASSKDLNAIELICNQFHQVVQRMRSRHSDRTPLTINDEYDVQDLFYSLLALYFSDIRREEYIPSCAGKNSQADFYLEQEKILIEIKKTNKSNKTSKIRSQLLEDLAYYQKHPNCKTIVIFVYDSEGEINNPRGFETDLESIPNKMPVKVFIRP